MSLVAPAASAVESSPFVFTRLSVRLAIASLICLAAAQAALAQSPMTTSPVTVEGTRDPVLDTESYTGSRLGLTPREIPATIDVMDAQTFIDRGFSQAKDALATMPGVITGGSPGNPFNMSMRGFTDNQVTLLRDGRYLGPQTMIGRPQNTFNLDRIEILKGPASILYGQGAVGGAVNIVTKQPVFGPPVIDAELTYGSFETFNFGIGGGGRINDRVAARGDFSRTAMSGYVHDDDPSSLNGTGALLIRASDDLDIKLGLDILHDRLSSYFGTPLVPTSVGTSPIGGLLSSSRGLVVDSRTRYNNYNVSDPTLSSTQIMPTLEFVWQASDALTLRNETYYFHAERRWMNAEVYDAITTPGRVQRDRFQVSHNQNQFGNIADATHKHTLFGLNNKATIGIDYSHIDFERRRGFPNGDSVDLFNPVQGTYGTSDFARRSPTRIETVAAFGEDVLSLTDNLNLVTGLRYESYKLDRQNFNADGSFDATTSFTREFRPFNYRAGLIYEVMPSVSLFGQYTTAQDPAGGSNIFLVNGNQNFELSKSREAEIGVKANYDNNRGRAMLALYDIERKNILTQVSTDVVETVGSQKSRGVEISTEYRLTEKWVVAGNASYTYATFGTFSDASGNYAGNRPANVPEWIGNLWNRYSNVWGSRFDLGGSLQYVGERTGDFANTLRLEDYTLFNLFTTYHVVENVDLTLRINNLFDKDYVQWADINYSANEVLLGAPRSYFATLRARF